jgi:hypothetical protein
MSGGCIRPTTSAKGQRKLDDESRQISSEAIHSLVGNIVSADINEQNKRYRYHTGTVILHLCFMKRTMDTIYLYDIHGMSNE